MHEPHRKYSHTATRIKKGLIALGRIVFSPTDPLGYLLPRHYAHSTDRSVTYADQPKRVKARAKGRTAQTRPGVARVARGREGSRGVAKGSRGGREGVARGREGSSRGVVVRGREGSRGVARSQRGCEGLRGGARVARGQRCCEGLRVHLGHQIPDCMHAGGSVPSGLTGCVARYFPDPSPERQFVCVCGALK